MPSTTDLLLLALVVLIAIVVAARSYMAWRALAGSADRLRVRAAALEERSLQLADTFALTRTRLAGVNVSIDDGLSRLPTFDEAVDRRSQRLVDARITLDVIRSRHLLAADEALARARSVVRIVKAALKLRRSWWA